MCFAIHSNLCVRIVGYLLPCTDCNTFAMKVRTVDCIVLSLTDIGLQNLALDLISALLLLPASRILRSHTGNKNFFDDLLRLNSAVNSDDFDIERVTPLLKAVINNESDDIIWEKAYAAVTESTPLPFLNQTPWSNATSSIVNSSAAFDTPLRSSSASQSGIEQTHDEVDQRILEELTGRVYYDVGGFFERYFEGKAWMKNARDIYEKLKD